MSVDKLDQVHADVQNLAKRLESIESEIARVHDLIDGYRKKAKAIWALVKRL